MTIGGQHSGDEFGIQSHVFCSAFTEVGRSVLAPLPHLSLCKLAEVLLPAR